MCTHVHVHPYKPMCIHAHMDTHTQVNKWWFPNFKKFFKKKILNRPALRRRRQMDLDEIKVNLVYIASFSCGYRETV